MAASEPGVGARGGVASAGALAFGDAATADGAEEASLADAFGSAL